MFPTTGCRASSLQFKARKQIVDCLTHITWFRLPLYFFAQLHTRALTITLFDICPVLGGFVINLSPMPRVVQKHVSVKSFVAHEGGNALIPKASQHYYYGRYLIKTYNTGLPPPGNIVSQLFGPLGWTLGRYGLLLTHTDVQK